MDQEAEERRLEQLRELNSAGIFSGVEGFLDAEAYDMRSRQNGSLHRLSWMPVAFALSRAAGPEAKLIDDDGSAKVGPIDDFAVSIMTRWSGVNDGAIVQSEILSHRDTEMLVTLAKAPGRPGLFCAPSNPLTVMSNRITLNSLGYLTRGGGPLLLRIRTRQEPGRTIVISRYHSARGDNMLAYWKVSASDSSRLEGEALMEVQTMLDTGPLKEIQGTWSPPEQLIDSVREDLSRWLARSAKGVPPAESPDSEGSVEYLAVLEPGE
jgi:hypothetical protein